MKGKEMQQTSSVKMTTKRFSSTFVSLFILIIFILSFSIGSAEPFIQQEVNANTLQIQVPSYDSIPPLQNVRFDFVVLNGTGSILTNTTVNCTFSIVNKSGVVLSNGLNYASGFFYIDSSGLSAGEYTYFVTCNNGVGGGATAVSLNVAEQGNVLLFVILSLLSLIILSLAFVSQNEYLGFISGALFIITGVYSMIYGVLGLSTLYTRAIAFTFIGLGLLFEIAAGYKVAEEARGFSNAG